MLSAAEKLIWGLSKLTHLHVTTMTRQHNEHTSVTARSPWYFPDTLHSLFMHEYLPHLCRCDCPWNYTGPACSRLFDGFCIDRRDLPPVNTCTMGDPTLCVNACNKRGKCMGGFCHCEPGEPNACLAMEPCICVGGAQLICHAWSWLALSDSQMTMGTTVGRHCASIIATNNPTKHSSAFASFFTALIISSSCAVYFETDCSRSYSRK